MPTTSILSENSEKEISVLSKSAVFNKEFTVYGTAENPLFLAKDVAIMIDYDWGSINKMLRNLDDDEKVKKHYTSLGSEDFGTSKKFNYGEKVITIDKNGAQRPSFIYNKKGFEKISQLVKKGA